MKRVTILLSMFALLAPAAPAQDLPPPSKNIAPDEVAAANAATPLTALADDIAAAGAAAAAEAVFLVELPCDLQAGELVWAETESGPLLGVVVPLQQVYWPPIPGFTYRMHRASIAVLDMALPGVLIPTVVPPPLQSSAYIIDIPGRLAVVPTPSQYLSWYGYLPWFDPDPTTTWDQ